MNFFERIFTHTSKNEVGILGLNHELSSIYVYSLFKNKKRDVLVVSNSLYEASKLYESISSYTDDVYFFPMDDFLTSEALAISPDLKMIRLDTITNALNNRPKIIVANLMGALRYLPSKQVWEDNIIELKVGDDYSLDKLKERLYTIGYYRETLVSKVGEVGVRGFIVDVFLSGHNNPIRIEFFGDNIESIRYFDVNTQRSIGSIDKIEILPFDEFIYSGELEDVERKQKYLPLVAKEVESIKEYLNNPILVYDNYNQIKNAHLLLREEIFNYHKDKDPNCATDYMFNINSLISSSNVYLMSVDNMFSNINLDLVKKFKIKEIVPFNTDIDLIKEKLMSYLGRKKIVLIALADEKQIKNIKSLLGGSVVLTDEYNVFEDKINIIKKDIGKGFIYEDIIIITKYELFKQKKENKVRRIKVTNNVKIKDINKFEKGDYIVHDRYGIGIYVGVVTLKKEGLFKDYIQIMYAGKDKLYIPVEKIDLISKYSGREGVRPKINKLGGSDWQKTKLKIRDKVKSIAGKLLRLSAERKEAKGYAFGPDTEEQLIFEAGFDYEETPDQIKAAKEIKEDMEKTSPMDRILCGDVGYGKTEVAFRAIFKAVSDSKQVAYLCPTTILSNQQYEASVERFSDFPIRIELLNRFTSLKKVKHIVKGLNEGTVDVVFGTHKLLNDKIKFKDLGLLIIDEEQRFGVMQKEKIKEYKTSIDILTLSATPIPRTLQMSMVGLRDLSLIETPPTNRYPVQTYVLEYSDEVIKQAIYKEMSRFGQCFILYNRVSDIASKVNLIKKLVPEARVTYAHGKMGKLELENRMVEFINGEYDVLVCTTIIETGIDIPNSNTLVIMDADRFGLSQLYQIRGRVGRSNRIAYAYLMYDSRKVLSETAMKRLRVIRDFTELGSGFAIAARDLSIRGAGDILGSEQAGFIDSVGIELYLKLLNDEIKRLKGISVEEVQLEENMPLISVDTHIEDRYVIEEDLKIEIHKLINDIDSYQKLDEVKEELEDRFGKIEEDVIIYMYEELFEKLARKYEIIKVDQNKKYIELIFSQNISKKVSGEKLFYNVYQINSRFEINFKFNKIIIRLKLDKDDKHYLYYIVELIQSFDKFLVE